MVMIVSLFCSQMSDIPEGCSWVAQTNWEGLIRIANGRQVLCLLCVSILETISQIKALSWREGTEAQWASLVGTMSSVHAQCFLPLCLLSTSVSCLCCPVSWPNLSCVQVLNVFTAEGRDRGDSKEPLNLVLSIICRMAVLSHSQEILNRLYDNEREGDSHKYQRSSVEGLKCLVGLHVTQICHWFYGFLNH